MPKKEKKKKGIFFSFFLYYSKLERLVERYVKDFLTTLSGFYVFKLLPEGTNLIIFSKKKRGSTQKYNYDGMKRDFAEG